jgi:hypothetical protein
VLGALQDLEAVLNADHAALRLVRHVAAADFTELLKAVQAVLTAVLTELVVVPV